MSLTEQQRIARASRITATDAAKIAGLNPWAGALDVQLAKRGAERTVDNERVKWGNILEGPIRADFAQRRGVTIATPGTLIHPEEDWAAATPDGVIYPASTQLAHTGEHTYAPEGVAALGGHEIKTHSGWFASRYGEPGTDEVPPWELVQCAWNQWVASAALPGDFERWHLTSFIDGLPMDYQIFRDIELEEMLVETCRAFHVEHVVEGLPLPPDGTQSYDSALKDRWPRNELDELITATDDDLEVIRALRDARDELVLLKHEQARLEQTLKERIGDRSGLEFAALVGTKLKERITWKTSKATRVTDWAAIVHAFRPELVEFAAENHGAKRLVEALDAAIETHTRLRPGARRFTVPRNWNA